MALAVFNCWKIGTRNSWSLLSLFTGVVYSVLCTQSEKEHSKVEYVRQYVDEPDDAGWESKRSCTGNSQQLTKHTFGSNVRTVYLRIYGGDG